LSNVPTKCQKKSSTLWSKYQNHHYFSNTYQEHLRTHANSCKQIAFDHQPHSNLLSFTDSMNGSIHYTLKISNIKSFTWFKNADIYFTLTFRPTLHFFNSVNREVHSPSIHISKFLLKVYAVTITMQRKCQYPIKLCYQLQFKSRQTQVATD